MSERKNESEAKLNFSAFRSSTDKLNFGDDVDNLFATYRSPFEFDVLRYREVVLNLLLAEYKQYTNFPRYFRVSYCDSEDKILYKRLSRVIKDQDKEFTLIINLPPRESIQDKLTDHTRTYLDILVEKYEEKDELGLEGLGIKSLDIYLGEEDGF